MEQLCEVFGMSGPSACALLRQFGGDVGLAGVAAAEGAGFFKFHVSRESGWSYVLEK